MRKRIAAFAIAMAALPLMAGAAGARADTTTTYQVTLDFSRATKNGRPLTDDEIARMKAAPPLGTMTGREVVYSSGRRFRTDFPSFTIILDYRARPIEKVINPASKTYLVIHIPTATPKPAQKQSPDDHFDVSDGMRTKVILGHTAHLYLLDLIGADKRVSRHYEYWTATDLPARPSLSTGPETGFTSAMKKITAHGLTLQVTVDMSQRGRYEHVLQVSRATSVSTDPIDASTFDVPRGYKQTRKWPAKAMR